MRISQKIVLLAVGLIIFASAIPVFTKAQDSEEIFVDCPSSAELQHMKIPLRYRNKSSDVKILQQSLSCLGYTEKENITGFYGILTKKAVREFFLDVGLQGSGTIFTEIAKNKLIDMIFENTQNLQSSCLDENPQIVQLLKALGLTNTQIAAILNMISTCPSTPTTIKIISPNGGEKWMVGETYKIEWNSVGFSPDSNVIINLQDSRYDSNFGRGDMTIVNTTNSGSYSFYVPNKIGNLSFGKLDGDNVYSIAIYMLDNNNHIVSQDRSDLPFSIIAPTSLSKIDVLVNPSFADTRYAPGIISVKIGEFIIKNNDNEDIKISNINLSVTGSNYINNLSVKQSDGIKSIKIGNTIGTPSNTSNNFYADNFTVEKLQNIIISVYADINISMSNDGVIYVSIPQNGISGIGVNSATAIVAPASEVVGQVITSSAVSLTVTKNASYSNFSKSNGSTNIKLAEFILQASNADDINVNTISLSMAGTTTNIQNLRIKKPDGTQLGAIIGSPAASGNTFTTSGFTISKSQSIALGVYGDIAPGAASGDVIKIIIPQNGISGTGVYNSVIVNAPTDTVDGQTINISSPTSLGLIVDKLDELTWQVKSDSDNTTISISIFDKNGNKIRDLATFFLSSKFTSIKVSWDKLTSNGSIASDGEYKVKVSAKDNIGRTSVIEFPITIYSKSETTVNSLLMSANATFVPSSKQIEATFKMKVKPSGAILVKPTASDFKVKITDKNNNSYITADMNQMYVVPNRNLTQDEEGEITLNYYLPALSGGNNLPTGIDYKVYIESITWRFANGTTTVQTAGLENFVTNWVNLLSTSVASSSQRDAQRQQDISSIQSALEKYRSEKGYYPNTGSIGGPKPNRNWALSTGESWYKLSVELKPYLSILPKDPLNRDDWAGWGRGYNYSYFSNGYGKGSSCQWYMLVYKNEKDTSANSPGVVGCDGTNFKYNLGKSGVMTVGNKVMIQNAVSKPNQMQIILELLKALVR